MGKKHLVSVQRHDIYDTGRTPVAPEGNERHTGGMKTNAMRILEAAGIPYEIITYEWDEDHIDAMSVAVHAGLDPLSVVKTLVTQATDRSIHIFCVPAPYEFSMKKARTLVGTDSLELVKQQQLRPLTGYIRGGVSPLGMIRPYPLYMEETIQLMDRITVSAGQRGYQLLLKPEDLLNVAHGRWADLV
jgi:Cys-tRNA(Pro)/Cys-tRNA(Cys) deacylase